MQEIKYVNSVDVSSPLKIRPVAGRIGAEIFGIELSDKLTSEAVTAIRAALVRHKVIFFRGQTHLDDEGQEEFTSLLGEIVPHATLPPRAGTKAILELDAEKGGIADSWHTDLTFQDWIPDASVLRCVVAPEVGGDTMWANTVTAYESLPDTLRDLADKLWAVHCNQYDYANDLSAEQQEIKKVRDGIQASTYVSTYYETQQPLVRVHPESGERALLLGHFVKRIVGLRPDDSRRLFATLQDYAVQPENTVRWRWQEGDVAIWDNRATQHRVISDFGSQKRVMRRVSIRGPAAQGIDGRKSRGIVAEPMPQAAE